MTYTDNDVVACVARIARPGTTRTLGAAPRASTGRKDLEQR